MCSRRPGSASTLCRCCRDTSSTCRSWESGTPTCGSWSTTSPNHRSVTTTCEPWWSLIARAAENPQVHAKVSGLYPVEGAGRFVDRALAVFGPERLMYGGDWPISVPSGGYQHNYHGLRAATSDLDEAAAAQLWSGTAQRFYRISDARLAAARERTAQS